MKKKLMNVFAVCAAVGLLCGFTPSYANACSAEPDAPLIAPTEDFITAKKLSKTVTPDKREKEQLPESETSEALAEAEKYAYLDYESATSEMKERILEARNQIIYSTSWAADGEEAYIIKYPSFEIVEKLPEFHDIFPEDWDIPSVASAVLSEKKGLLDNSLPSNLEPEYNDWAEIATRPVYLEKASTEKNAEPFGVVYMNPEITGTDIGCFCLELTSSKTCNIGFSDFDSGENLLFGENLLPGQGIVKRGVGDRNIAVRASTYSIPGWSEMLVCGAGHVTAL